MRKQDLITLLVWASGSFALALAVALPVSLNATDGGNNVKPKISQATLIVNGVELSVVEDSSPATQPTTQPSDVTVRFKLVAANRSDATQTIPATVSVYQTSRADMMSRSLSQPKSIWQNQDDVVLAPGQKVERTFNTGIQLKPGVTYSVMLGSGKQRILAYSPKPVLPIATDIQASANSISMAVFTRQRSRLLPIMLGVTIGLFAASDVISLIPGRLQPRVPTGPMMSECDGGIHAIVIQYVSGASDVVAVYRQFLQQLPDDLRVYAVCPNAGAFGELQTSLGSLGQRLQPVVMEHEMTAWSRDRWIAMQPLLANDPVTLVAPRDENAASAWPARAGDARLADDIAAKLPSIAASQRSSLYFDGGDLLCDGHTVFVTPAVIRRNIQVTVQTRADLMAELHRLTGCDVVLLDNAPDHHAGMFMMAAGEHTVVVGDPSLAKPLWESLGSDVPELPNGPDFSTATQRQFDSVADAARAAGYRVVRIPTVCSPDARTYITYLNGLIDQRDGHRTIYLPQYDHADALNQAAAKVWQDLGYEVRPVNVTSVYRYFGTLHCLVNVLAKG